MGGSAMGGRGLRPRSSCSGASSKRPARARPSPSTGSYRPEWRGLTSSISWRGSCSQYRQNHPAGLLVEEFDIAPAQFEDAPLGVAGVANGDDLTEARQLVKERLLLRKLRFQLLRIKLGLVERQLIGEGVGVQRQQGLAKVRDGPHSLARSRETALSVAYRHG